MATIIIFLVMAYSLIRWSWDIGVKYIYNLNNIHSDHITLHHFPLKDNSTGHLVYSIFRIKILSVRKSWNGYIHEIKAGIQTLL